MRLLALIPTLAVLLSASSASAAGERIPVAIVSDDPAATVELEKRILLDEHFVRSDPDRASLCWVLGQPSPSEWQQVIARVRGGAGLILVPGAKKPDLSRLGISVLGALDGRVTLQPRASSEAARLIEQVVWPSAPQAGARWTLRGAGSFATLIAEEGTGRPALLLGRLGAGRVAVFSLRLTDRSNQELLLWPYFNYFAYALSATVAGERADDFARWPHSPVPGSKSLWILLSACALAWLLTVGIFLRVRRYSRRRPELLETFFQGAKEPPAARSAAPTGASTAWTSVGFTRPLAGFLTLTGAMLILFAPYYYVTNILIPNDVQPFPQAKGMWDFAWEALQVAWFLFDAGTFVAFVKYFAEFKLKDPAEALRSAQFFVWWQILTGLVQVTLAGLVAVLVLPHTRYGFSSNFVILVALSQYPGFFGVVTFFFQAYQRFDYNIGVDLLSDWVLRFGLMIPCVLLGRSWGVAHPEYGEAFGAALGMGVGFYVASVVAFGVGVGLYRRLGLKLTPLFLAHFDRRTAWRMLRFGSKVVAGQAFFRAAKTIDRVVISLLLLNYTEWLGIEGQINYNLMFLFPIAYRFFETAMAAFSESHGNGKKTLTQYYVTRFLQVGYLYTAIGMSLLWALGPSFVQHAMDAQWGRAAGYLTIAAAIGAFYAPAWLSDMLQKGADRPGLFAWVLAAEQALRIALFWVLIPRLQFQGYYLAIFITIILKVGVAWLINHRVIVRLRLFYWQMLIAPALAGLFNFGLLRLADRLLGLTGRVEVILFFFAAALLSFFVCFFVCGLAGGFDRAIAEELDQASRMTGFLRPLTRCFYFAARAGWSISPAHNRFPVTIHDEAMKEARELERGAA